MCTGRPSAKAERMAESAEALAAQAGESTAVTASHSSCHLSLQRSNGVGPSSANFSRSRS